MTTNHKAKLIFLWKKTLELAKSKKKKEVITNLIERNKPDRATMRPGCVSACIDHVTYMERQMDEQTGEMIE